MGMWWLCWNFYAVGPPAQPKMPSLLMNFRLSMGWMHSIVFPLAPSLRYHQLTQTLLECAMAEWCRKIQVKMWSHRHTSFFHQQWITSFFALKVRSVSMHLQKIYIYIAWPAWMVFTGEGIWWVHPSQVQQQRMNLRASLTVGLSAGRFWITAVESPAILTNPATP